MVTVVMATGSSGSSTPPAASTMASATSIPEVTLPMIWYVL